MGNTTKYIYNPRTGQFDAVEQTVTISYTTAIPFTNPLTIITGKILTTNDVFTIAANAVEGNGAQLVLIGDGSALPDLTAFDLQVGTYDSTAGIYNLLTFEVIDGKYWVSILNATAI
ncbi:MAG: hypothetical protein PHX80_05430 [Candidatus Nanoarchaeia archaeon]|nr:hypothetical protein [Candidatus Nanoarchaeia archaeon]